MQELQKEVTRLKIQEGDDLQALVQELRVRVLLSCFCFECRRTEALYAGGQCAVAASGV